MSKDVKLSKKYQIVKHLDYGGGSQKNKLTQWGSPDINVYFDVRYEGHQNCPKILSMNILRVLSDHHMWCQNWRQYLCMSLCQFTFFVNLLHSPGVWFFDIWHPFDNLTSFDILVHYLNQGSRSTCDPVSPIPIKLYPIAHVAHMSCTPYPCTLLPIPLYPIPP